MRLATHRKRTFLALLSLALIATAVPGYQAWRDRHLPADLRGVVRADPSPLGAFRLTDHRGRPLGLESLMRQWTLISFGFTHCPDICPANLMQLTLTLELLAPDQQPAVWFISVDPERDTPDVLADYVGYFHPTMVGATGDTAELQALEQPLAAFHRTETPPPRQGADHHNNRVAHSADVYLIDPHGRYRARFAPPLRPADLARQYTLIRDSDRNGP
ncbi:MAG: SCO family protein [Aquisalimonadaceae bacterium]